MCGSAGSLFSAAALLACGKNETGSPYAPVNAISHWYWGEDATRKNGFTFKHTVLGYVTHHLASVFWGAMHEWLFGARRDSREPLRMAGDAATSAAIACAVDYRLTPRRLMPGYEQRLSRTSLLAVYAAFAAGLVVGGLLLDNRRRR
jgi:hypothetical protein